MATLVQGRSAGLPRDMEFANEARSSSVSWGAIIAGAFAASALSLILIALGAGVGLSAMSLWPSEATVPTAARWTAIFWLIVVQLLASAMGGYLAGRLRTKWVNVHTHEVYFRDTAHGFLVWCVGLVVTTAVLGSAASSTLGNNAGNAERNASRAYFADSLFRSDRATGATDDTSIRNQAQVILSKNLGEGELSGPDKTYLAQLVSARTGLSGADAEKRVSDVFSAEQQSAEIVRHRTAHALYWTFLALLMGAFCASYAATIGGRQRDLQPAATN